MFLRPILVTYISHKYRSQEHLYEPFYCELQLYSIQVYAKKYLQNTYIKCKQKLNMIILSFCLQNKWS